MDFGYDSLEEVNTEFFWKLYEILDFGKYFTYVREELISDDHKY